MILIALMQPYLKELQRHLTIRLGEASGVMSSAYKAFLDALVESTFTFSHQALRPTEVCTFKLGGKKS